MYMFYSTISNARQRWKMSRSNTYVGFLRTYILRVFRLMFQSFYFQFKYSFLDNDTILFKIRTLFYKCNPYIFKCVSNFLYNQTFNNNTLKGEIQMLHLNKPNKNFDMCEKIYMYRFNITHVYITLEGIEPSSTTLTNLKPNR